MSKKRVLPPGSYYVGDPCLVIREADAWQRFCAMLWEGDTPLDTNGVIIKYNTLPCFVSATNTGDGCYADERGNLYPVDSGMIAAIHVAAIGWPPRSGRRFDRPVYVGCDEGRWLKSGKSIYVGTIIIHT